MPLLSTDGQLAVLRGDNEHGGCSLIGQPAFEPSAGGCLLTNHEVLWSRTNPSALRVYNLLTQEITTVLEPGGHELAAGDGIYLVNHPQLGLRSNLPRLLDGSEPVPRDGAVGDVDPFSGLVVVRVISPVDPATNDLLVWNRDGRFIGRIQCGGAVPYGSVKVRNRRIVWLTSDGLLGVRDVAGDALVPVPLPHVLTPAHSFVPVLVNGQWWITYYTYVPRPTAIAAHPWESFAGYVLTRREAWGWDCVADGDDLVGMYAVGRGEQPGQGLSALVSTTQEPREDLQAALMVPPPLPPPPNIEPPIPIVVQPFSRPIALGQYFFYYGGFADPWPDPDAASLPYDHCVCFSAREVEKANAAGLDIVAGPQVARLARKLVAIRVANDGGADLGRPLDAIIAEHRALANELDRPLLVYLDGKNVAELDAQFPSLLKPWDVFSWQTFRAFGESLADFEARARACYRYVIGRGVKCLAPAPMAFDRNVTGWPANALANTQSVHVTLAREFNQQTIALGFFNWGRERVSEGIGGTRLHQAEILPWHRAMRTAMPSGARRWPKPSQFQQPPIDPPPPPIEPPPPPKPVGLDHFHSIDRR